MSTTAVPSSSRRIVNGREYRVVRIATAVPQSARREVNANPFRHVHAHHVRHFVPAEPGVERP